MKSVVQQSESIAYKHPKHAIIIDLCGFNLTVIFSNTSFRFKFVIGLVKMLGMCNTGAMKLVRSWKYKIWVFACTNLRKIKIKINKTFQIANSNGIYMWRHHATNLSSKIILRGTKKQIRGRGRKNNDIRLHLLVCRYCITFSNWSET